MRLISGTAVKPQDIRRAIAEEKPQIVHFCGHGLEDGSLLLEDDGGQNKAVPPEGLASLFELHANYVNCVLLNACHSAKSAEAISEYINYAIGMNQEIQDKSAIQFAQGFYDGLGYATTENQAVFPRAFQEGRVAIKLENLSQAQIPVIKKKIDIDIPNSSSGGKSSRKVTKDLSLPYLTPTERLDFSQNLKITMLGTNGVGKYSYLIGMYSMLSKRVNGFTLSAKDKDTHISINDCWEQLVSEGYCPLPPCDIENYCFDFNYNFKNILSFEWLRYPGTYLRGKSSEVGVQYLLETINNSSCLFLSVSGEHLTQSLFDDHGNVYHTVKFRVSRKISISRMNCFLISLLKRFNTTGKKLLPVAIIITKFDLIKERSKDGIVRDIKELFSPLFYPGSGLLVMICPVSLGKELAENPIGGKIEPVNLHFPIFFAVYCKLTEMVSDIEKNRILIIQELESYNENVFLQILNKDKIVNGKDKLSNFERQLKEIKSYMNILAQELTNVPIFFGDREVVTDFSKLL